jgi:hypothetical protein
MSNINDRIFMPIPSVIQCCTLRSMHVMTPSKVTDQWQNRCIMSRDYNTSRATFQPTMPSYVKATCPLELVSKWRMTTVLGTKTKYIVACSCNRNTCNRRIDKRKLRNTSGEQRFRFQISLLTTDTQVPDLTLAVTQTRRQAQRKGRCDRWIMSPVCEDCAFPPAPDVKILVHVASTKISCLGQCNHQMRGRACICSGAFICCAVECKYTVHCGN